ncbi:hypothetical protein D3C86_1590290 [compost metagenome]
MANINAQITLQEATRLVLIDTRRASFDGRTIEFTTSYYDHLEIRAIREANGHIVSSRDLGNWPEHRIAADKGIMALFASNKKWKSLKLNLNCYRVKLDIVDEVHARVMSKQADILHLVEVVELISHGFGYMSTGVFAAMAEISRDGVLAAVYAGDVSQIHVKVRVGALELWQPLAHVAAAIPRRQHQPVREEVITTSAGDVIGALLGAGMSAWLNRNKF